QQESLILNQKLFSQNDRVLGVHLRGTDYAMIKPYQHPIIPPIEFAISMILLKLEEWHCNKIFLATEDKNIMQIFKDIFGDLCVTFNREYINYTSDDWITVCRIQRDNDHFLTGKEYLLEMLLLAQCNSFISVRCSGAVGVMMLAEQFEHTYFFNLGTYGEIGLD
ncbi:MAG: hypothetical protein J5497_08350, partial [Selenomonadaceae bacterium]|nr:hypothetical protein [Selenomonadaceae bacterium]